jgi:hypothetical protein
MRLILTAALMLSLSACASTQSPDAVRDGTVVIRRQHAAALVGGDVPQMRETGERLLTALACGWGENGCPR